MKLQPFRKNCEGRKKTVRVECECITTGMTMTFLKKIIITHAYVKKRRNLLIKVDCE